MTDERFGLLSKRYVPPFLRSYYYMREKKIDASDRVLYKGSILISDEDKESILLPRMGLRGDITLIRVEIVI